jgi:hypothetical protein
MAHARVSPSASEGLRAVSHVFSALEQADTLCGQFATALHNSELQIYATLVLVLVLSMLLFPPKNDPDQI